MVDGLCGDTNRVHRFRSSVEEGGGEGGSDVSGERKNNSLPLKSPEAVEAVSINLPLKPFREETVLVRASDSRLVGRRRPSVTSDITFEPSERNANALDLRRPDGEEPS